MNAARIFDILCYLLLELFDLHAVYGSNLYDNIWMLCAWAEYLLDLNLIN